MTPPVRNTTLLPYGLLAALHVVGAPVARLRTPAEVTTWAETGLGFRLMCGPAQPGKGTTGRVRHWVRLDPHTGMTFAAPSESEVTRTDAAHLLWALTSSEPAPCQRVWEPLATWVGPVHPKWLAPWSASPATNTRMMAVRTVLRAVEYLDAGFHLPDVQEWLAIGAHPDTVTFTRQRLRDEGLRARENSLCAFLRHKVGLSGDLKPGEPAISDHAWLNACIEGWLRGESAALNP